MNSELHKLHPTVHKLKELKNLHEKIDTLLEKNGFAEKTDFIKNLDLVEKLDLAEKLHQLQLEEDATAGPKEWFKSANNLRKKVYKTKKEKAQAARDAEIDKGAQAAHASKAEEDALPYNLSYGKRKLVLDYLNYFMVKGISPTAKGFVIKEIDRMDGNWKQKALDDLNAQNFTNVKYYLSEFWQGEDMVIALSKFEASHGTLLTTVKANLRV